jgi:hypothetical protein
MNLAQFAPYLVGTANAGTAVTTTDLVPGVSAAAAARLPKRGDLLWAWAGTNNSANPAVSVADPAAGQWAAGPLAGPGSQRLGCFLAVAPRDYTAADVITGTWTSTGTQRSITVKGCPGWLWRRTDAQAIGSSGTTNVPSGSTAGGGPVRAPALVAGAAQTGAGGGQISGLTFGEATKLAWQAATNQWCTSAEALTTTDLPELIFAGTLAGANPVALVAFAVPLPYPLKVWDGAGWPQVAAQGARVWDGTGWRAVQ